MGPDLIEGEDFYYAGIYVVFTAKFLLARGYCCESGCRHCPWDFRTGQRSDGPPGPPCDGDDRSAD